MHFCSSQLHKPFKAHGPQGLRDQSQRVYKGPGCGGGGQRPETRGSLEREAEEWEKQGWAAWGPSWGSSKEGRLSLLGHQQEELMFQGRDRGQLVESQEGLPGLGDLAGGTRCPGGPGKKALLALPLPPTPQGKTWLAWPSPGPPPPGPLTLLPK